MENENISYKEKIIKQEKEIDRVNELVSSRERYHMGNKLKYTIKLFEYDSKMINHLNNTNIFLNKQRNIYQTDVKYLKDEIAQLNMIINKLKEEKNSELVKQLVEQRVVALDTKVFELMDKEKKHLEQEEQNKKEIEKYKNLYNILLEKK